MQRFSVLTVFDKTVKHTVKKIEHKQQIQYGIEAGWAVPWYEVDAAYCIVELNDFGRVVPVHLWMAGTMTDGDRLLIYIPDESKAMKCWPEIVSAVHKFDDAANHAAAAGAQPVDTAGIFDEEAASVKSI